MKKVIYILVIFLLMLQINVFASEDEGVSLSLDCENLTLARGEQATCDLNVTTISTVNVDNVSLDIEGDTDLIVTYEKGQFFYGNLNSGHLVLSSSSLKSESFKLGKIKIKVSDEATYDKKNLTIKNIVFSNSTSLEMFSCSNVSKEISILSNDNFLETLKIDGVEIDKFDKNTLKYDLEIEKEKIKIEADASSSDAKVEGVGNKDLKYGKNTFEIKVTSQNGSVKTYALNITRPDKRSDVNTLKTLILEGIKFNFDSKKTEYKFNVESDVDVLKIDSTLTDSKATYVKDFGNREVDLKYGENKVLIKVLSEKGNEKVYTITVNREDDRNDVAKLISLKINDNEIELKDDVYEYDLTLLYRFEKTKVEASANLTSKVEYEDIDLKVGDNLLVIKVISEKETTQEYKINIKRLTEEESKAYLKDIKINGYELNFTKDITTYNLKINEEDKELDIEVYSNDLESINYSVTGNTNLKNGSVITISGKDDIGDFVYTINIIKDVPEQLIFGFLTIEQVCYIIFSIGLLSFLCSIIRVIRVKSRKKK